MTTDEIPAIERVAWVVADNFKEDVGGFCFQTTDYKEFIPLFGIEDFKAEMEAHIKSLGKDLVIAIEETPTLVWVTWGPPKAEDER